MKRFLIDTDTASDDAVALVMVLRHPDVQVEAITVVAGNVPLEQGVQNALYTVELCGVKTPVYAGIDSPILRPLRTAQDVHGSDGMGDINLPLSGRTPTPGHAVDVLIETINRYPGEVTLVTLGPLTNVAVALLRDPSIAYKVEKCVTMGGTGQGPGNTSPVAEYNFWVDPEAAKIVLDSGMSLTMVGWDISIKYAVFNDEDAAALRAIGTPLAEFCVDIQGVLRKFLIQATMLEGFDMPDPIAMAIALEPDIATVKKLYVTVETGYGLCQGQSLVDHLSLSGQEPNVDVVIEASREGFLKILYDSLKI